MAIEKTELTETDETNETNASDAKEQADREKQAAMEKKLRDEEIARARAESALEESRRHRETPAPQGVTEEQWQTMEAETGQTRQAIQANAKLMAAMVDAQTKPLAERTTAAEKRAQAAEDKASRLESRRSLDTVESSFYEKNAAIKGHKKLVDEFLSAFPDADNVDAKTLEKRLAMASNYVKGQVKEVRNMPKETGKSSSTRIESSETDKNTDEEEIIEFDERGTDNEGQAYLMRRVARDIGKDVRDPESIKVWKAGQDIEGKGVRISSQEDVDRARAMTKRGGTLANR